MSKKLRALTSYIFVCHVGLNNIGNLYSYRHSYNHDSPKRILFEFLLKIKEFTTLLFEIQLDQNVWSDKSSKAGSICGLKFKKFTGKKP